MSWQIQVYSGEKKLQQLTSNKGRDGMTVDTKPRLFWKRKAPPNVLVALSMPLGLPCNSRSACKMLLLHNAAT